MTAIPHHDILISSESIPERSEEFKQLMYQVRPNWKYEDVITSRLTAGCVNVLIGIHHKDDVHKDDHVLVRINKEGHKVLINFKDVLTGVKLSSKYGYTPSLYATFTNGFVQELIPIQEQTNRICYEEPHCRSLGELLAHVHALKKEFEAVAGVSTDIISFKKTSRVISFIPRDEEKIPPESREFLKDEGISREWLESELNLLEEHFKQGSMQIVMGHGAFHSLNILVQKMPDTHKVFVVDFESCGLEYDGYDLAFLKSLAPFFRILGVVDDWMPSNDDFRRILRHYLRARNEINHRKETEPNENEVENFYQNVLKMTPIVTLYITCLLVTDLIELTMTLSHEQTRRLVRYYKEAYMQARNYAIPENI